MKNKKIKIYIFAVFLIIFITIGTIKLCDYVEERNIKINADKYILQNYGSLEKEIITVDTYNRIQTNMTYNEVAYIMNGNGIREKKSGKTKIYKWEDTQGNSITITFVDNQVANKEMRETLKEKELI